MHIFYLAVVILCSVSLVPAAERVGLSDLVNTALLHNAGMKAVDAQVRQADAEKREVSYSRLGRVNLSGSMTHGNNPVYVFGSLLEQGRFGPSNFAIDSLNDPSYLTHYTGTLSANLPLFTAFELSSKGKLAEFSRRQAVLRGELTANQIRWTVIHSYLQLLCARQTLTMLDERIASSARSVDEANRLRDRGLVLGSDYFVAESILEGLKGWRIQVQSDATRALSRLVVLTGKPVVVSETRLPETVYAVAETESLVAQALNQRAELRLTRVGVESAETAQFQARNSYLPHASAFGQLQSHTNDFSRAPSNALIGLRLDVPIGDPAYGARRDRAIAEVESQKRMGESIAESVTLEVTQAAEEYRSAVLGLSAARETRQRAAKALELFRPLYRAGRQSVMEVLRAEEGLSRAEASVYHSLIGVHAGWAQLQQTMGRLDGTAVEQLQSQLEAKP